MATRPSAGFSVDAVGTPVFFSGAMNFGFGGFFLKSGSSSGGRIIGWPSLFAES